ncbi:MAG: DUF4340 domain-containing protein [Desulfohalobiaceae bacterium]|nr:DUF4340 domain-containing protein [Desulfohalobiaceae bacterium]
MKLKKEYLIIVLVIIGLSVYIYSRTSERINYELPQIAPIETDRVTRIRIAKQDEVIDLARDKGRWVVGQRGYPARAGSIEDLLTALDRFRVTDLVSRSRNYSRYSLDREAATGLKAWAGQELVRSFLVGKQASTYRNSYVRLANDPNIYLSRSNWKQTLNREPDDFQDKVVLDFDEKRLRKIVLQGPKGSLTLKRGQNESLPKEKDGAQLETALWRTASGQEIDQSSLNKLLQSMAGLTCSRYLEGRDKQDFKSPDYRLVLDCGQEDVFSLYLGEKQGNAAQYHGISEENGFPFALSEQKGKEIVEALDKLLNF